MPEWLLMIIITIMCAWLIIPLIVASGMVTIALPITIIIEQLKLDYTSRQARRARRANK